VYEVSKNKRNKLLPGRDIARWLMWYIDGDQPARNAMLLSSILRFCLWLELMKIWNI